VRPHHALCGCVPLCSEGLLDLLLDGMAHGPSLGTSLADALGVTWRTGLTEGSTRRHAMPTSG
jgi:hypothetical protein